MLQGPCPKEVVPGAGLRLLQGTPPKLTLLTVKSVLSPQKEAIVLHHCQETHEQQPTLGCRPYFSIGYLIFKGYLSQIKGEQDSSCEGSSGLTLCADIRCFKFLNKRQTSR